jgi:hypothetical protein
MFQHSQRWMHADLLGRANRRKLPAAAVEAIIQRALARIQIRGTACLRQVLPTPQKLQIELIDPKGSQGQLTSLRSLQFLDKCRDCGRRHHD